jgi:DNA-binding HxlR family transcriptional regulator
MALLDLLGRRWALRDGSAPTFRELQARCGEISSSVLNDRLRELREAGIVAGERTSGYRLSDDGHELLRALAPIDAWAHGWAERTDPGW